MSFVTWDRQMTKALPCCLPAPAPAFLSSSWETPEGQGLFPGGHTYPPALVFESLQLFLDREAVRAHCFPFETEAQSFRAMSKSRSQRKGPGWEWSLTGVSQAPAHKLVALCEEHCLRGRHVGDAHPDGPDGRGSSVLS